MNWVTEIWTSAERLILRGGANSQIVLLVFVVLAVVLVGSWVQSRIAQ